MGEATLFGDADEIARPRTPPQEWVIRELVDQYGVLEELARGYDNRQAFAVLNRCRMKKQKVQAGRTREADPEPQRRISRGATGPERWSVADMLERDLSSELSEIDLWVAVKSSLYVLSVDELRRLALHLVKLLRTDNEHYKWGEVRMRVYIAGPISTGDLATNIDQATAAFVSLAQAGFAPFCPHWSVYSNPTVRAIGHTGKLHYVWCKATASGNGQMTYEDWLAVDLPWVECADAILRLPGESEGADREVRHAIGHAIPVFHSVAEVIEWRNRQLAS